MAGNLSAMTWWEYVTDVAGGAALQKDIAAAAKVSQATVSRWRSGEIQTPEPGSVVEFARSYQRNVLEALLVARVIRPDEVQVMLTRHEDPSDEQLLDLLRRRLERDRQETSDGTPTNPAGESPATDPHAPPVDYALAARRGRNEGARRRRAQDDQAGE